jgi:hypothetical protein
MEKYAPPSVHRVVAFVVVVVAVPLCEHVKRITHKQWCWIVFRTRIGFHCVDSQRKNSILVVVVI